MKSPRLHLTVPDHRLGICRIAPEGEIPHWAQEGPFFSITRTSDELSVVCPEDLIPEDCAAQRGWRCFKVRGPLDFDQTGVLLSLAAPLAEAGISIFSVSTYDTDYLLVKHDDLERAVEVLSSHGHRVDACTEP